MESGGFQVQALDKLIEVGEILLIDGDFILDVTRSGAGFRKLLLDLLNGTVWDSGN